MFDNIGSKIKTLAAIVCWIGIVVSVVTGFVLMAQSEETIFIGILTLVLGIVFSWIGSFMAYGFGQLVENTDKLVTIQNKTSVGPIKESNESVERMNTLNKWLADGLITTEEYNKKIAELKGE